MVVRGILEMLTVGALLMFVAVASGVFTGEDVRILSDLPIGQLLSQKSKLKEEAELPSALPLTGSNHSRIDPLERMQVKGLHRQPLRKTIFEHDADEDWSLHPKSKFAKLFEVSVTILSFLAFGSYLFCLLAYVMRYKNVDKLAAMGANVSPQIQLLQRILSSNKSYPVRIPASSFFQSARQKRWTTPYNYYAHLSL